MYEGLVEKEMNYRALIKYMHCSTMNHYAESLILFCLID